MTCGTRSFPPTRHSGILHTTMKTYGLIVARQLVIAAFCTQHRRHVGLVVAHQLVIAAFCTQYIRHLGPVVACPFVIAAFCSQCRQHLGLVVARPLVIILHTTQTTFGSPQCILHKIGRSCHMFLYYFRFFFCAPEHFCKFFCTPLSPK